MLGRSAKLTCDLCKRGARVVGNRYLAAAASKPSASVAETPSKSKTQYKHGKFRSDAEVNIKKIPAIEVEGHLAVCEGGGGSLGHPIEYIQLDNVNTNEPVACMYCGLRYVSKGHHHH